MKDLETALQEELERQKKKPAEVEELVLDCKCKATNVKGLEGFTNLAKLSLVKLGLTSLDGFPHLPSLTSLNLADNRISGGLEYLVNARLHNLKFLRLPNNRIASLEELKPLSSLKLTSLDLFECPVVNSTPDFQSKVFTMLDELKYLNNYDRSGAERDADDDEEEEYEEEGGEEEYDEEGGAGEGEEGEEYEEGEGEGEDEEGEEYEEDEGTAILVAEEPAPEDEEDYEEEDEPEDDDAEDDDDDEEAGPSGGAKRKRDEEEEEGDDDDEDE